MYKTTTFGVKTQSFSKKITVCRDESHPVKAIILYFHGGGLLYGKREDLPDAHLRTLTSQGYAILSYDYPLAPAAKLDLILSDVLDSILDHLKHGIEYLNLTDNILPPYFLWGRSAGAYLCLLASTKLATYLQDKVMEQAFPYMLPTGILSYYGYGFLTDGWYDTSSSFYKKLPKLTSATVSSLPKELHCNGDLETHYSAYVYARQTGCWKSLFYEGREKFFYLDYSLRLQDNLTCPVFAAHSTGDPDVPYAEFQALCTKYATTKFITSSQTHDFDRDTNTDATRKLLEETVTFLDGILTKN